MELAFDVVARLAVLSVGALLFLHFLWRYVAASFRLLSVLGSAARQVNQLSSADRSTLKRQLEAIFQREPLKHLWTEFEETLHEQRATIAGQRKTIDIRATIPAEVFFNSEAIVDNSLRTEYFKHLPGIFTGLGIIGTFAGLIAGLIAFDPSGEPAELKRSLDGLFGHVQEAFLVSAVAISAAILVTLAEKLIYAAAVRRTLAVAQAIDKLFRSGIGEEYLASLVQSTQENATQTRQLRDTLVEDLKVLLTNLTDRQIAATQSLGEQLGQRIETSLKAPIDAIAASIQMANKGHGELVQSALENLLSAFMTRMEEIFGGQIGQLNALMQQTAGSMTDAQSALQSLVEDLRSSSEQAGGEMRAQMAQMLTDLVTQQQAMLSSFEAAQRGATVEASSGLSQLQGQVAEMAKAIATVHAESAREDRSRRDRSDEALQGLLGALDQRVAGLADSNTRTQAATESRISAIQAVSMSSIEGLNAAAGAIQSALSSFEGAGARLVQAMTEATAGESRIVQASQALSESAVQLRTTGQGLTQSLKTLGAVSEALQGVAQSLETEVVGRESIVSSMRTTAEYATIAAEQMQKFFQDVETGLTSTFNDFGDGVGKALNKSLAEYERQLSSSVRMLKSAMEELAENISDS